MFSHLIGIHRIELHSSLTVELYRFFQMFSFPNRTKYQQIRSTCKFFCMAMGKGISFDIRNRVALKILYQNLQYLNKLRLHFHGGRDKAWQFYQEALCA